MRMKVRVAMKIKRINGGLFVEWEVVLRSAYARKDPWMSPESV